jgi:2'-5' RNA ligase
MARVDTFGDRRGPRVILVTVQGDIEPLRQLARRVDEGLAGAGFGREKQPYRPHLTLARVPDDMPPDLRKELGPRVTAVRAPRPGPHRFASLSLMRSHIERGGARYERVRSYRLSDR